MSIQPTTPGTSSTTIYQRGPNLVVRFIWWLFIGRLPSILTLRPRTREWSLGQDGAGNTVVADRGREQVAWPIRGVWFLLVGWWASGIWMAIAWLIQLTVIGIPIALLMFNRTPFIASLYRY
jgi:hypothetical protein